MGAAEALGGLQQNVPGGGACIPCDTDGYRVGRAEWLAALANPPPTPPLQGVIILDVPTEKRKVGS